MSKPFPGVDVPLANIQTGLMSQTWLEYFQDLAKIVGLISGSSSRGPGLGPAWSIANLRADNTPSFESVAMNMTADYVIFYNPVSGPTYTVIGSSLIKTAGISSAGPSSGGRDQAAAFASGNVVWFYYIYGASGVGTITSLTGPTAVNGGGTTGPVLPTGYSYYSPAFVLPLVGSATLNPTIPQGGSTQFQIRGNTVSYANIPEIIGAGFPTMNFNLSTWVPAAAQLANIMLDVEIHSSGAGAVLGGAVPSTSLGNFGNVSLYPPIASSWYAQDPTYSLPLPGGLMSITFLSSAGVIDNAIGEVWIRGYTF